MLDNKTDNKRIIIIGAGASGLMAAIWAARGGASVTVLEHGDRAGRKLLLTGSGKCNFTNMLLSKKRYDSGMDEACRKRGPFSEEACQAGGPWSDDAGYADDPDTGAFRKIIMEHYHGDPGFAASAIEAFDASDAVNFFKELGVEPAYRRYPYDEGIYVYPASMEAGSVLRALIDECERLGVHFVYNCEPKHIKKSLCWEIETSCGMFEADAVIFAAGSNAAPKTGSDSSIYPIIKELEHDFSPFMPALCGLKIEAGALEMLKGVRTEAGVSLHVYSDNDMMLYQSRGEVQISSEGISGVCVMDISRYAAIALKRGYDVELSLRLMPWLSEEKLRDYVKSCIERDGGKIRPEILAGALPIKLSKYIVKQSGLTEQDSFKAAQRITELLSDLRFRIKKTAGFDHSQAASGGVSTLQIDEITMESKLYKGIYFCGELLDVDGSCGGYNLQFAWSSGKIAGSAAASD